ncbi:MAG: prenyltransferase [Ignavibacteriales bacterium CG18_big_fil_WC_8_21_14_2_50_31_20]|nr:MAG: prenyltransferase [Ignavibacteriales bacterium CG18_big_fil_WC_8_21_14_2_50_31_20]
MGQLLALGEFATLTISILGFLSVFSISASILVLNDYFDVETDKINAPHRPIPSNLVSPLEALIFSLALLFSGLILSYLMSFTALLFSITWSMIGFLYNRRFKQKGIVGNILVSLSVGMTFIYGGVSVGLPFNKIALFFGVIGALVDLGEEIAADSMDMKGDLIIDSKSLAIKYGKETAIKISSLIFVIVILLTSIPFIANWFSLIYLLPIGIMDLSIAYFSFRLFKAKNEEGRKYIRMIYLGTTLGLIIFLILRLILD